jgi:hypothetical protein
VIGRDEHEILEEAIDPAAARMDAMPGGQDQPLPEDGARADEQANAWLPEE